MTISISWYFLFRSFLIALLVRNNFSNLDELSATDPSSLSPPKGTENQSTAFMDDARIFELADLDRNTADQIGGTLLVPVSKGVHRDDRRLAARSDSKSMRSKSSMNLKDADKYLRKNKRMQGNVRLDNQFSGFYKPSTLQSETYAGAWLCHKDRLIKSKSNIESIANLEGASFHLLATGLNLMTRDYFDWQVLHLSSTSNNPPRIDDPRLQQALIFRMNETIAEYRKAIKNRERNPLQRDQRMNQNALAVIPFAMTPASYHLKDKTPMKIFTNIMRQMFLEATVLSVYITFPNILIGCGSEFELAAAKAMSLPVSGFIDLSANISDRHLLPRQLLLTVIELLQKDGSAWKDIQYVYYSESDQILHARHVNRLLNLMDSMDRSVALIPHRMHTIALPKSFPELTDLWKRWHPSKIDALEKVSVHVEDAAIPRGSCCDDGRYDFADCGIWWHGCKLYGLHNYSDWIRFGKDGFTMPLGTEHQAKCRYSDRKRLCPMPKTCRKRIPLDATEVCDEIPELIRVEKVTK